MCDSVRACVCDGVRVWMDGLMGDGFCVCVCVCVRTSVYVMCVLRLRTSKLSQLFSGNLPALAFCGLCRDQAG